MAEFKIKKEKFDILLNLIAKTDNKELQNAFLDYQNEKNENNEGYLNYIKDVCLAETSIGAKAALPLQNVSTRLLTENECKQLCYDFTRAATPSRFIGGIKERFEQVWNSSTIEEKLNGC